MTALPPTSHSLIQIVIMDEADRQEKKPANLKLAMVLAAVAVAMYLFAWFKDWS